MNEPKNKGGRPPKKPEDKRSIRRLAAFTQDEYKRLSNSTGKLEMSNSEFMRASSLLVARKIDSGEMDLDEFTLIAGVFRDR